MQFNLKIFSLATIALAVSAVNAAPASYSEQQLDAMHRALHQEQQAVGEGIVASTSSSSDRTLVNPDISYPLFSHADKYAGVNNGNSDEHADDDSRFFLDSANAYLTRQEQQQFAEERAKAHAQLTMLRRRQREERLHAQQEEEELQRYMNMKHKSAMAPRTPVKTPRGSKMNYMHNDCLYTPRSYYDRVLQEQRRDAKRLPTTTQVSAPPMPKLEFHRFAAGQ